MRVQFDMSSLDNGMWCFVSCEPCVTLLLSHRASRANFVLSAVYFLPFFYAVQDKTDSFLLTVKGMFGKYKIINKWSFSKGIDKFINKNVNCIKFYRKASGTYSHARERNSANLTILLVKISIYFINLVNIYWCF